LLSGTHINVSGIATALGYAETSAFSHAFHRMAGVSPFAWRTRSEPGGIAGEKS
jgi:AraC-like DNA-binding protein